VRPLVVVGHAARDLVDDDARGWRLGGSATYVSLAIARLGLPVRAVVGVDPEASRAEELRALEDAGVQLHRILMTSGPVFRNVETPTGRRQECLAVGAPLDPRTVPSAWQAAPAWALVPVLGEVAGAAWAGLPASAVVVAVGWQGLLRDARAGGLTVKREPAADPILERADITVVGTDDLPGRGEWWDDPRGADAFVALFPREGQELAVTAGDRGGRLFTRAGRRWTSTGYAALPARVSDWTGAGDVFLAGLLASTVDPTLLADGAEVTSATAAAPQAARLRFAAAVAAMSIEGPGISAIPTRAAVRERLATPGG
jgi:sugar/nucleoside kinase (ribokinase family)